MGLFFRADKKSERFPAIDSSFGRKYKKFIKVYTFYIFSNDLDMFKRYIWKYFGKFSFENWRLLELWFYFPQVYESVTKVKTPQS